MSEYKKSAEFQALIDKYAWINIPVRILEAPTDGQIPFSIKAKQFYRLLGGLDLLFCLAKRMNSGDDADMIIRVNEEAKALYADFGRMFSAPVMPGDTVYDICPPDDDVPAVICPYVVDDVSTRSVFIDDVAIPHEDIGRTVFKTREEAERYIAETWGEQA